MQSELGLEHLWVTEDGYFRISTTVVGFTVEDARRLFNYHLATDITVKNFTNYVSHDLIYNDLPDTSNAKAKYVAPCSATRESICIPVGRHSTVSSMSDGDESTNSQHIFDRTNQ